MELLKKKCVLKFLIKNECTMTNKHIADDDGHVGIPRKKIRKF